MINPDFLRRCGVVIEPGFLDPQACLRVAGIMGRRRQATPATVYGKGKQSVIEAMRRTRLVSVPPGIISGFGKRLDAWQPRLADHFQVKLVAHETLQFLRYTQGDHFRAHVDRVDDAPASSEFARRRVSVVVFLNASGKEDREGDYAGGNLVLYGLLAGEKWKQFGAVVPSSPGMLVAFSSDLRHEVTAVTSGMRATVVSWYLAPET